MRTAYPPAAMAKELRALAPSWAAVALTVAGAAVVRDTRLTVVALMAFMLGAVALPAHAIGHEYTHRTLGVLLALPRERQRVLLTKLGVLVPLQLTLAALAWWALFRDPEVLRGTGYQDFPAPWLASITGFFLAPWLTLLCRSTMAGVVLTLTIPPALMVLGNLAGGLRYGDAAALIDRFTSAVQLWGTIVLCAVGGVAGWVAFMRLEVIEGAGREFHLPAWPVAPARRRRRSPLAALVGKELRLQGLTFVLFGLFVMTAAALSVTDDGDRTFVPITVLYTALVSVLIGSLAIAEERQFATMDLQRLLPVALWKQWLLKTGVAFAIAVTLGIVIPLAVQVLLFELSGTGQWRAQAMIVVMLTSLALYLSSISPSGVRAAVMAVPVVFGITMLGGLVQTTLWRSGFRSGLYVRIGAVIPVHLKDELHHILLWSPFIFVASMASLMLWLTYRNYRSGEWTPRRVALQMLGIASLLVFLMVAHFIADAGAFPR